MLQLRHHWAGGFAWQTLNYSLGHHLQPPLQTDRHGTHRMYVLEQFMQQADFAADILLLRHGQLTINAGGLGLVRLADNKHHLMPVYLTNNLMIKVLIHCQCAVISLISHNTRSSRGSCSRYSAAYSVSRALFSPTPGRSTIVI